MRRGEDFGKKDGKFKGFVRYFSVIENCFKICVGG